MDFETIVKSAMFGLVVGDALGVPVELMWVLSVAKSGKMSTI